MTGLRHSLRLTPEL
jgi:serine/threonine protein kinase